MKIENMKMEDIPKVIEPLRFKLWQKLPLFRHEIEIIDEALKKLTPKEPIITGFINDKIAIYECQCGLAVFYKEHKYCPECGEKLDWGNEQ